MGTLGCNGMKKEFRIKKNEEFSRVFNEGKSVANRQFVLYFLRKEEQKHFRIGLSVSKRVGNAVTRNRIKRIIRVVFHELKEELKGEYDFVVIARQPTAKMNYHEMKKSLHHVLKLARVFRSYKERTKREYMK